jgi:hypothetical protein
MDCLGHKETELSGQPSLWRHRDGRHVSEDEAAVIAEATGSDMLQALNLRRAELEDMREQAELRDEFDALIGRAANPEPGEKIRSIIDRLAPADAERAREIWQRLGPRIAAWLADQPHPKGRFSSEFSGD